MRGPERGAALHNLKRLGLFLQDVSRACSPHFCSRICWVAWRSDSYPANMVSLSSLFGALPLLGDGVGGDLSLWWREACNEVQVAFLSLILGRMHHRSAHRGTSTAHTYYLTIRLRRVNRVVFEVPLGKLCNRNDRHWALQFHEYDILCHIVLLLEDQELRWCLPSSFYSLRVTQRDPLIDPVH